MAGRELLQIVERYENREYPYELDKTQGRWTRTRHLAGEWDPRWEVPFLWGPSMRDRARTATLALARALPTDVVKQIVHAIWGRFLK